MDSQYSQSEYPSHLSGGHRCRAARVKIGQAFDRGGAVPQGQPEQVDVVGAQSA